MTPDDISAIASPPVFATDDPLNATSTTPLSGDRIAIWLCEHGPHKGRTYAVKPDGSIGRRVFLVDRSAIRVS